MTAAAQPNPTHMGVWNGSAVGPGGGRQGSRSKHGFLQAVVSRMRLLVCTLTTLVVPAQHHGSCKVCRFPLLLFLFFVFLFSVSLFSLSPDARACIDPLCIHVRKAIGSQQTGLNACKTRLSDGRAGQPKGANGEGNSIILASFWAPATTSDGEVFFFRPTGRPGEVLGPCRLSTRG